jgi:glycosyltransferase involved in cell wall biosynthesis
MAEKAAVRFADKTVVVSKSLQNYFINTYGYESVYIPNGLNVVNRVNTTDGIAQFGITPNNYILFASRLVPEKGCHDLIQAFNCIKTNMKLVIAGDSRYQTAYINELKLQAHSNKVIFTGHATGTLLQELFSHAYLFVLPSYMEGLSTALLEALSFKKCALVSNIPENLEVIGEHGYSFQVGNADALKDRLEALLTCPDKITTVEQDLEDYIHVKYSWDDIAGKYEQSFLSLK